MDNQISKFLVGEYQIDGTFIVHERFYTNEAAKKYIKKQGAEECYLEIRVIGEGKDNTND